MQTLQWVHAVQFVCAVQFVHAVQLVCAVQFVHAVQLVCAVHTLHPAAEQTVHPGVQCVTPAAQIPVAGFWTPQMTVPGPHSGVNAVQVPGGQAAAGKFPGTTPIIKSRTLNAIKSLLGISCFVVLSRTGWVVSFGSTYFFSFFASSARRVFSSSIAA